MISFLLSVRQSFRIILVILYVSCIMALSLLPPNDLPQVKVFEGFDKVVHFLMYLPLSALLCWNLKVESRRKAAYLAVAVAVLWGIVMEFMQLTMHLGRSFSWYDEGANFLGAVAGAFIYLALTKKRI